MIHNVSLSSSPCLSSSLHVRIGSRRERRIYAQDWHSLLCFPSLPPSIIIIAGYYTVREALALTRKLIESKMGKPKLVRETSKTRWGEWMSILPASILRATGLIAPLKAQSDEVVAFFQDVVLPPDLRSQVGT